MAGSPADPANARARHEEPRHLVVGHISKAHGTRGEVFVWPLTDDPERVFAVGEEVQVAEPEGGPEPDEEWRPLVVERRRPFKRGMLVKFEGLDDRTAVEPLAGRYILMPLEKLAPLEEGEVYYHQLLGAEVVTVEGEVVGRVREVFETEPAHLLEVKGDGKVHLIPFTERIVKQVDIERKRLVIEPPTGLLEI
ncbi:MAG TPA: ribosome maturation factor RimM [Longimicrobiales bacterium]